MSKNYKTLIILISTVGLSLLATVYQFGGVRFHVFFSNAMPITTYGNKNQEFALNINPRSKLNVTLPLKQITIVNVPGWMLNSVNSFSTCKVSRCTMKLGKGMKFVNTSDAVIFYGIAMPILYPPKRVKPDQVWLAAMWESPYYSYTNTFSRPAWHNQINWTMTYRFDSEISVQYGLVRKIKDAHKNYSNIISRKTKLIAWVVSHCGTPSKREHYIKLLNQTLPVHVFGRCGTSKPKDIFATLNQTYKFYLSFENSLCNDYITEKFFDRQNSNIVPIVRGLGNYSLFYPKNSFIDTRDFSSAQELGKYLLYLDKNNTAYIEYLKAKEKYYSETLNTSIKDGMCRLCSMLHSVDQHQHVYKDVHEWYSKDQCSKATDISVSLRTVKPS